MNLDKIIFCNDPATNTRITLETLKTNANVVPRRSTYSRRKRGEIIYDATDKKYYGNHAADGATPDWQELGAGTGGEGLQEVKDDPSPQLGGNLDVLTNRIISSTGTIIFASNTGRFIFRKL